MEDHYPQILRRYMGEERIGRYEYYDKTTKDAADICGRCQETSEAAKGSEPVSRQKRAEFGEQVRPLEQAALIRFAKSTTVWVSEKDFLDRFRERKIGAGAEQKVYLKEDGLTVVKVNAGRFHSNWLEYFNRLLFHSFLFPATKYKTISFTEDEGAFAVITKQAFAILSQGAPREVVESYLVNQRIV